MKKRTYVGTTVCLLLTASLTAQQSFGLQNHPGPKNLKEQLEAGPSFWSDFQSISLTLLLGIASLWIVYLGIVLWMNRKPARSGVSRRRIPVPHMNFPDIPRPVLQVHFGQPNLAFVDNPKAKKESESERTGQQTGRGNGSINKR